MRVHAVALASTPDAEANLALALAAVRAAADDGAALVVLPEYARAFDPRGVGRAQAEPLDVGFVPALQAAAREHGVAVVAGTVAPDGALAANVVVAVDAAGELVGAYRKVHLYDAFGHRESDRLVAGDADAAPVVVTLGQDVDGDVDGDAGGLRVGVLTCYDLRFPESARRCVDAGADVLVVPAAWATGSHKEEHWRTLLRARAIENTCYVIGAAQQGRGVTGSSTVIDPDGVVLAEAGGPPGGGPSAAVAEVSADVVASVRERNPSLVNRRYAVVPLPGA